MLSSVSHVCAGMCAGMWVISQSIYIWACEQVFHLSLINSAFVFFLLLFLVQFGHSLVWFFLLLLLLFFRYFQLFYEDRPSGSCYPGFFSTFFKFFATHTNIYNKYTYITYNTNSTTYSTYSIQYYIYLHFITILV